MDDSGESRPRLAVGVLNDSSRGDGGGSCFRRWSSVLLSIWTDLVAVFLQGPCSVHGTSQARLPIRASIPLGKGSRSQHCRISAKCGKAFGNDVCERTEKAGTH